MDDGANVSALAYTPGGSPQALGIDTARETLVRIDPPDEGILRTIGPLGLDAGDPNGFDIDAGGAGWAVFSRDGRPVQDLMGLDLATGRASRATKLSAIGTFARNQPDPLRALTVAGTVADDRTRPGVIFTAVKTPRVGGLIRGRPRRDAGELPGGVPAERPPSQRRAS